MSQNLASLPANNWSLKLCVLVSFCQALSFADANTLLQIHRMQIQWKQWNIPLLFCFVTADVPLASLKQNRAQSVKYGRWGSGFCLMAAIDGFAPGGRAAARLPLRMPVRDIFRNARGTSLLGGKLEVCFVQFTLLT